MEISKAYAFINDSVEVWGKNLFKIIEKIKSNGKTPMLIALSRKMPRFMDWVIDTRAEGYLSSIIVDTIANVDLTTELALPFLFQSSNIKKYEFIILDDVIIYGSTLRSISDTLFLLTGVKSHVSCILRNFDSGNIDNVDQEEFQRIPIVNQTYLDEFIDCISIIVENTQLPIDLEFPVFKIDETFDQNSTIAHSIIKNSFIHGLKSYAIDEDGVRFSINLTERNTIGNNTDFAKVRFFNKKSEVNQPQMIFEVISPMVFSQSELLTFDSDLFENEEYQRLWNLTTKDIRWFVKEYMPESDLLKLDRLKSNFIRTLCVWASYLYSLSVYIKNIAKLIPHKIMNLVSLSFDDLSLVVGRVQADSVYPILVSMIQKGIVSVSYNEKVLGLPKSFCPKPFENELQSHKIFSGILSDSVCEVITDIFKYQHYSNPKFSNRYIYHERPFFGETFESIREAYQPYFDAPENFQIMHQWVDNNVDSGFIVPKYECVSSKSGVVYWKRYFHSGIRRYKSTTKTI